MTDPVRRRPSPAVYRRRRLAVLLALIAVVAVVGVLIWQPWNGFDTAADTDPTGSPTTSAGATPTASTPGATETPTQETTESAAPEETVTAVLECTAASVTVTAVTDKDTYAGGESPQLSISVANTSGRPCTMNVGTATQTFTVSSGSDVWWRSTDCQTEPTDQTVTLEAGQTVQSVQPLTWDRTRSSVSTCGETDRPVAPGGGSSFHLSVSIGGVESASTKQFFLY